MPDDQDPVPKKDEVPSRCSPRKLEDLKGKIDDLVGSGSKGHPQQKQGSKRGNDDDNDDAGARRKLAKGGPKV